MTFQDLDEARRGAYDDLTGKRAPAAQQRQPRPLTREELSLMPTQRVSPSLEPMGGD
jgi:hypothetical protein